MGPLILFNAGEEGIEPSHGGTRTHCLTAWLLPNNYKLSSISFSSLLPLLVFRYNSLFLALSRLSKLSK